MEKEEKLRKNRDMKKKSIFILSIGVLLFGVYLTVLGYNQIKNDLENDRVKAMNCLNEEKRVQVRKNILLLMKGKTLVCETGEELYLVNNKKWVKVEGMKGFKHIEMGLYVNARDCDESSLYTSP